MRYRVRFYDRKRAAFVEARHAEDAVQQAGGERIVRITADGRRQYPNGQVERWFYRVLAISGNSVASIKFAETRAEVEEAPL